MKVTDFAKQVTLQEGNKRSLNIAQISEVLKIANELTSGEFYKIIRNHSAKKTTAMRKTASKQLSRSVTAKKRTSKKN